MKEADIHPCFTCSLPDCHDQSPRCALRQAGSEYSRRLRKGEEITPEIRAQYAIAYRELYYGPKRERMARRAGA